MKKAYITLLSSDKYGIAVLALNEALKKVNSKYPLAVLVTDDISNKLKNVLKGQGIVLIESEKIQISDEIKNKNSNENSSNWNNTFDKLTIFELTDYDKLIYLDSDMYIRKNIDHLFEADHLSATVDRHCCIIEDTYTELTSGIMVIKPQVGLTKKLVDIIDTLTNKYKRFGDQDVIQEYYKDWKNNTKLHLPITYNMFFVDTDFYVKDETKLNVCSNANFGKYKIDDIYVFHFIVSKKPWDFEKAEDYLKCIEEVLLEDFNNQTEEYMKEICNARLNFSNRYKKLIIEEYFDILHKVGEILNNDY